MRYTVELTTQAENDLKSIFEYITIELKSYKNGENQLNRLEKQILNLEILPSRYPIYEKEPWHSRKLRLVPVDNYIVFYIINENDKKVVIIRIMYCGRDIDNQLNIYTDTQ